MTDTAPDSPDAAPEPEGRHFPFAGGTSPDDPLAAPIAAAQEEKEEVADLEGTAEATPGATPATPEDHVTPADGEELEGTAEATAGATPATPEDHVTPADGEELEGTATATEGQPTE